MWAAFQAGCFALTGVCLRALFGAPSRSISAQRPVCGSEQNYPALVSENTQRLHTLCEATSRTRMSSLMAATSGQKLHLQTGTGKRRAATQVFVWCVSSNQRSLSLSLSFPPPPPAPIHTHTATHTHISSHSCLAVDASANQYVQFWRNTALPWQRSLLSYGEENCKLYSLVSVPPSPLSLVIL